VPVTRQVLSRPIRRIVAVVFIVLASHLDSFTFGETTAKGAPHDRPQPQIVGDASTLVKQVLSRGPQQSDVKSIRQLITELDQRPLAKTFMDPISGRSVMRAEGAEEKRPHRLLQRTWHALQADGTVVTETWELRRIGDRDDADKLSSLSLTYTPWCEEVLAFETRVITPSDNVLSVPATQIIDRSVDTDPSDNVYSDNHERLAVLPGIQPGAIVESCRRVRRKPWFPHSPIAGTLSLCDVESWRVHYAVMTGDPGLKHSYRQCGPRLPLIPLLPDASIPDHPHASGGVACMQFDSVAFFDWFEASCNPLEGSMPVCRYATDTTWEEQGLLYREEVETALDVFNLETIVRPPAELMADGTEAKIRWSLDQMAGQIRYTGWSLGDRAVFPAKVEEVWQRGFGDCKDQATLLVAMLRKLGVDAHVAAIKSSSLDIETELPNLSWFNHAIVAVRDNRPEAEYRFVDPTLHCDGSLQAYPVYMVSPQCRGHQALVCDRKPKLVKLDDGIGVIDNGEITLQFQLNETGNGCLTKYQRYVGWPAIGIPDLTNVAEQERLRDSICEGFQEQHLAALECGLYRRRHDDAAVPTVETICTSATVQMADFEDGKFRCQDNFAKLMENTSDLGFYLAPNDEDITDSVPSNTLTYNVRRNPVVIQTPQRYRYRVLFRVPGDVQATIDNEGATYSREHLSITTRFYEIDKTSKGLDTFLQMAGDGKPLWNVDGFSVWKQKRDALKLPIPQATDQLFVCECDVEIRAGEFSAKKWNRYRDELTEAVDAGLLDIEFQSVWTQSNQLRSEAGLESLQQFLKTQPNLDRQPKQQQLVITRLIGAGMFETAARLLKSWEAGRVDAPRDQIAESNLALHYLLIHLVGHHAEALDYRELLRKTKCDDHPAGSPLIDTLKMFAELQTKDLTLTIDQQKVHSAVGKLLGAHEESALFDCLPGQICQSLLVACLIGKRDKLLLRYAETSPVLQSDPLIMAMQDAPALQDPQWDLAQAWRVACMAGRQDLIDRLSEIVEADLPDVLAQTPISKNSVLAEAEVEAAVREHLDAIIRGDLDAMRNGLADYQDDDLIVSFGSEGGGGVINGLVTRNCYCATQYYRRFVQSLLSVTAHPLADELWSVRISRQNRGDEVLVGRDINQDLRISSTNRNSGMAKIWSERYYAGDQDVAMQWSRFFSGDIRILGTERQTRNPSDRYEDPLKLKQGAIEDAIIDSHFDRAPVTKRLIYLVSNGNRATFDEIAHRLAIVGQRDQRSMHIRTAECLQQHGRYADAVKLMGRLPLEKANFYDVSTMLEMAHEAKLAGQLADCGEQWKTVMSTFYNGSQDAEERWVINYLVQRINGKQNEMTYLAFQRLAANGCRDYRDIVARTAIADAVRFGYPSERLQQSLQDTLKVYPAVISLDAFMIAACTVWPLDDAMNELATCYDYENGYPLPELKTRLELSEAILADRLGLTELATQWRKEIVATAETSIPVQIAISIDRQDASLVKQFSLPNTPVSRVAKHPQSAANTQPSRNRSAPVRRSVRPTMR
jgi:hypothetical protein